MYCIYYVYVLCVLCIIYVLYVLRICTVCTVYTVCSVYNLCTVCTDLSDLSFPNQHLDLHFAFSSHTSTDSYNQHAYVENVFVDSTLPSPNPKSYAKPTRTRASMHSIMVRLIEMELCVLTHILN